MGRESIFFGLLLVGMIFQSTFSKRLFNVSFRGISRDAENFPGILVLVHVRDGLNQEFAMATCSALAIRQLCSELPRQVQLCRILPVDEQNGDI